MKKSVKKSPKIQHPGGKVWGAELNGLDGLSLKELQDRSFYDYLQITTTREWESESLNVLNHKAELFIESEMDSETQEPKKMAVGIMQAHTFCSEANFQDADAISEDMATLYEVADKLRSDSFGVGLSLLFIDKIHVYPSLQGYNLGLRMLHQAIEMLTSTGGYAVVALTAYPLGLHHLDDHAIEEGCKKLRRHYHKIGFRRVNKNRTTMALSPEYVLPKPPPCPFLSGRFH